MVGPGISRLSHTDEVTIAVGAAKPADRGVDFRGIAGGLLMVRGGPWTAADIGFEVASFDEKAELRGNAGYGEGNRRPTTYYPLVDKTGARVKITSFAVDKWHELPAQVLMCGGFVKPVSIDSGTGADLNQTGGADRIVKFQLKT